MRDLTTKRDGGAIRVVTLSNVSKFNAISDELRSELIAAVSEATSDPECRAIILAGEGQAFCAGGDLSTMPTEPKAIKARMGEMHLIVRKLVNASQLVLSAVEGVALGSGMSLAACADIVVASEHAKFGCQFGRVALIPDVGYMWSVVRRIGMQKARVMALQNLAIDGAEALRWGLADFVCEGGEALEKAVALAREIITTPAATIAHSKGMLAEGIPSLEDVFQDELARQIELLASKEFSEARTKFLSRNG